MKKIFTLIATAMLCSTAAMAQEQPKPVYFTDFSSTEGLTIVGNGVFEDDTDTRFGKVFQNDPVLTKAIRTNYLLLPADVLSHSSQTKAMTIGFWVNASKAGESAGYMWAPLFMAYGAAPVDNANTWPMFACQYRGVLQLNCFGFTDYVDEQNTAGINTLYHNETDWLADKKWHYYTVVLDNENAKVYFDGVLKNEWNTGSIADRTQMGIFTNGGDLKYICLGGNQAWNWADPDPAFAFDDFAVYDKALTKDQIDAVIADKNIVSAIETVKDVKANGIHYNLAGQQVTKGFKGIVIENGKKFFVK